MRARGAGLQAGFFFSDLWPGTQILHHRQRAVAQPGSGAVHLRAASPVPRGTVAESVASAPWLFCRPQTKAPFMLRHATCLPCAAPPFLPVTLASLFLPSLSGEGRACCTESAFGAWELLAQA